ncbi:hypothetical protein AKJ40_00290 [candidate division MSBL1 archaeon SCGC-AAA259M10]|uniref:Saccharopine dehydrogenase n=2 Tax=candidate division MSBL1 TaxID=215777 RepID=A0A133U481_9EURY|nr:hypothetical protein AKJ61_03810 [candidate division MSBL1 archaeon SCGC-AAA259B11]KXB00837.1 hypothetical protein AKJ40_00290 [candidate division MSBL1 archaeon SCGC-AAA259M10]
MSKIFIMGAVGEMCIEATRDIVKTGDFDKFMLADKDGKKLKKLTEELDDVRIETMTLDATDKDAVAEAISGYNIVMDGLPFDKIEPTVRACLQEKIPHIDLISPLEVIDRYEKDFEENETLAVAGVGMTPGLTDLMARYGVERCDKVNEIYVYWAAYRPFAISPGLVMTTYWEMDPKTEERAYYENGEFHPQPPMQKSRTVRFEPPYEDLDVYHVPHPETFTLPKNVPEVEKVETMGTWPPQVMNMLKQMLDYGFFDTDKIEYKDEEYETLDLFAHILHQVPGGQETPLWGYALRVEVHGEKNDEKIKYILTHSHPAMEEWGGKRTYAKNVAIPMSIGAQMIQKGKIQANKGYHTAFETFKPEEFFQELKKRGIRVHVENWRHYDIS